MAAIISGPAQLDWVAYVGDANAETVWVSQPGGGPVSMLGAVVEAQVRVSAPDPVIALQAVVTIPDPLSGTFTIEWPGEEMRALVADLEQWVGVWDCQVTLPGADLPTTILRGKFTAVHDVTRNEGVTL